MCPCLVVADIHIRVVAINGSVAEMTGTEDRVSGGKKTQTSSHGMADVEQGMQRVADRRQCADVSVRRPLHEEYCALMHR